ncbi:uncharacterized protein LOC111250353 isoform X2 [Varroa destructor]|uniref:Uncharacterized protein n=1 Tax=Varroa destructor TaxID=109461 RepID=A0A7M7K636_VARDE|nr:uncharacterized protein LOC111250353 isoform X2 [Varroa destructor]
MRLRGLRVADNRTGLTRNNATERNRGNVEELTKVADGLQAKNRPLQAADGPVNRRGQILCKFLFFRRQRRYFSSSSAANGAANEQNTSRIIKANTVRRGSQMDSLDHSAKNISGVVRGPLYGRERARRCSCSWLFRCWSGFFRKLGEVCSCSCRRRRQYADAFGQDSSYSSAISPGILRTIARIQSGPTSSQKISLCRAFERTLVQMANFGSNRTDYLHTTIAM